MQTHLLLGPCRISVSHRGQESSVEAQDLVKPLLLHYSVDGHEQLASHNEGRPLQVRIVRCSRESIVKSEMPTDSGGTVLSMHPDGYLDRFQFGWSASLGGQ